jgi:hypothetical protein
MSTADRREHRTRSRVLDYLLYIVIGFAIAFAFIGITFFVQNKWGNDAFIRGFGLVVFTAGLFGLFLAESRELFRTRRFWEVTSALLLIHLLVFTVILLRVEEWRMAWFMVMVFEYPALIFFRSRIETSS